LDNFSTAAPASCFDAFSPREPATTSLENAIAASRNAPTEKGRLVSQTTFPVSR
jgi:hypothetical protein